MANIGVGRMLTRRRMVAKVGAITARGRMAHPRMFAPQSAAGFNGVYKLAGQCKLSGAASSGYMIRITPHGVNWTVAGGMCNQDGSFEFKFLAAGPYTIYAYDVDDQRRGVIWDYVNAVLM